MSKAADKSNRMRTDDLESAFAIRRASVTDSSAVSVECPLLKPDWLAFSRLCFDRNYDNWLKNSFKHFGYEWKLGLGIENRFRFQNRILKVRNRILVVKLKFRFCLSIPMHFFFFFCEDRCDLAICQDLAR